MNLKWINFNLEVNIEEDSIERDDLFSNEALDATLTKSEEKRKPLKEKIDKKENKEELAADTSDLQDQNLAEKIDKLNVNESIVPDANNDESMNDTKILKCDCGKNTVPKYLI